MMRAISFAFAAALAWLAAAPALAEAPARAAVPGPDPQWEQVNQTDTGRGYVDRRNIQVADGKVRYSGLIVRSSPDEYGAVQIFNIGEIDCARHEFRIVAFDTIGQNGEVLLAFTNQGELAPEPIAADSPNATLHSQYCR